MNVISRLFCLLIFFVCAHGMAQTGNLCRDTALINPGAVCPANYEPVCGCNSKTYRNLCFAFNDGVQQYNSGICENVDIDAHPNPVVDILSLSIAVKSYGEIQFFVFDRFGKKHLQTSFFPSYTTNIASGTLDLNFLPLGMYILVAQSSDFQVRKKLIKVNS